MSAQPNIRQGTIEVANALAELGLRLEYIGDAVLAGELARDSCTANDPPGAGGYFSYARTTRALREILAPLGWSRDDSGLSTVISPDGITIDVVTGNSGTGIPDAFPNCKYPRGTETDRAVFSNQLSLLDRIEWPDGVPGNNSDRIIRQTWMLLRKRVGDRINVELSLPDSMTADGCFVERWAVRIILDIDLGLGLEAAVVDDSVPPIDVPVRRRS